MSAQTNHQGMRRSRPDSVAAADTIRTGSLPWCGYASPRIVAAMRPGATSAWTTRECAGEAPDGQPQSDFLGFAFSAASIASMASRTGSAPILSLGAIEAGGLADAFGVALWGFDARTSSDSAGRLAV